MTYKKYVTFQFVTRIRGCILCMAKLKEYIGLFDITSRQSNFATTQQEGTHFTMRHAHGVITDAPLSKYAGTDGTRGTTTPALRYSCPTCRFTIWDNMNTFYRLLVSIDVISFNKIYST